MNKIVFIALLILRYIENAFLTSPAGTLPQVGNQTISKVELGKGRYVKATTVVRLNAYHE